MSGSATRLRTAAGSWRSASSGYVRREHPRGSQGTVGWLFATGPEAQHAAAGLREESWAAHLAISHGGRYLYASNRGHDSIVIFDIQADGRLAVRKWVPTTGRWPWHFLLTQDGRRLVANNLSDQVAVFDVGPDGDLLLRGQVDLLRPVFISPAPARASPELARSGKQTEDGLGITVST